MAAKKGGKKQDRNRSLKRSGSRPRRSGRALKEGLQPQPTSPEDRTQAMGHGNQRALLAENQAQGSPASPATDSGEFGAPVSQAELTIASRRQVEFEEDGTDMLASLRNATRLYARTCRAITEAHINRVMEALNG